MRPSASSNAFAVPSMGCVSPRSSRLIVDLLTPLSAESRSSDHPFRERAVRSARCMNAIKSHQCNSVKGYFASMQEFAARRDSRCILATEWAVVDWLRIRVLLSDSRRAKGLDVKPLADAIGVKPSTVYRIENIKKYPDHRPALQTISDWLGETTQLTLSSFFSQIETPTRTKAVTGNDREALAAAQARLKRLEEDLKDTQRALSDLALRSVEQHEAPHAAPVRSADRDGRGAPARNRRRRKHRGQPPPTEKEE